MARDLQRAENSLQPSSATQVRDSAVQLVSGGRNDVIIEEEYLDFSDDDEFDDADEGELELPGDVINIESDNDEGD